jgi:PEP-CTERM/exosortase A-associated glycosyltransferase
LRILHILDHSLPLHSGYVFRTLSLLREQRARGWDTVQLTTPRQHAGAIALEDVDGWRFYRTPHASSTSPAPVAYLQEMAATAARIETLVRELRPDILHAHSPVLNALPALRVGRRHRLPVVYELRAMWEDAAVDHGTTVEGSVRYRLSRMLETYVLKRVDHVTTICEGLRGEILARGVPAAKVTVIPNAVDARQFSGTASPDPALRARLGLDGATVVGFAGSFYAYEGLHLLVEALDRLRSKRPELRLLLVGGGPQEEGLRKLVAEKGLGDKVVFTGRVPHDHVPRYYDLMDVLAYPRLRIRLTDLVTPLKPLEAMAQGRIVVASDVGGHRELIDDRKTGFLFEAANVDALARTIDEVATRREAWPEMRHCARRFVENERTWSRSVAGYAPVYAELTSRQGASLMATATGKR